MSEAARLIEGLEQVLPSNKAEGHTNVQGLQEATRLCQQLAAEISGNSTLAAQLGATSLPSTLYELLFARPDNTNLDLCMVLFGLANQVAAVVLALVEGCEANIDHFFRVGYPKEAMHMISHDNLLPTEHLHLFLVNFQSNLIKSLVPITSGTNPGIQELGTHSNVTALLDIASRAYTQGDWTGDDRAQRGRLVQFIWMITMNITPNPNFTLTPSEVACCTLPLRPWMGEVPEPPALRSMTAQEWNMAVDIDLTSTIHAATILKNFCGKLDLDPDTTAVLSRFVQSGTVPSWFATGFPTRQQCGLCLMLCKKLVGDVLDAVNHAHSFAQVDGMEESIKDAADKLRADKDSSEKLPHLLCAIPIVLMPNMPMAFIQSHVGLLCHLATPPANRPKLAQVALPAILKLYPWQEACDSIEGYQWNALTVTRSLVQEPMGTATFLSDWGNVTVLLGLAERTPSPRLAELCRSVLANAVAAFPKAIGESTNMKMAWKVVAKEQVVSSIASMLLTSNRPVTFVEMTRAMEGMVARPDVKITLSKALMEPSTDGRRGIDAFAEHLARPRYRDMTECRAQMDAVALIRKIGGEVADVVREKVGSASEVIPGARDI